MIIYAAGIDWNEIIVFNPYSYKTCILYICKKNTQENEGKNYAIGIHHNWEISITSLIDTQIWSFTSKFDFSSCSYSGNNLTSEHL